MLDINKGLLPMIYNEQINKQKKIVKRNEEAIHKRTNLNE